MPAKEKPDGFSSDLAQEWGCLLVLGPIAAIIWFVFLPASWTNPITYGKIYGIDSSKVEVIPKPTDCDFMHAPLGDKGCHYKKFVYALNRQGEQVKGDGAPKFSVDAKGNQLISYDDGKTWQFPPEGRPIDRKVSNVVIDWVKVTE